MTTVLKTRARVSTYEAERSPNVEMPIESGYSTVLQPG